MIIFEIVVILCGLYYFAFSRMPDIFMQGSISSIMFYIVLVVKFGKSFVTFLFLRAFLNLNILMKIKMLSRIVLGFKWVSVFWLS